MREHRYPNEYLLKPSFLHLTASLQAIWYLGLSDAIDVVYGSSAGALIGAYFIADQLPYTGPEIYYDVLTSAGKNFIDKRAMLRSMGLGALDLSPKGIKSLFTER